MPQFWMRPTRGRRARLGTPRLGKSSTCALLLGLPDRQVAENTQVWFAHREEIPLVAVALGLFNNSDVTPTPNINDTMPTTHIPTFRLWRTSDILPFISHIALERLECGKEQDVYVRAVVNSMPIPLPTCRSGPGESCQLDHFRRFFDERVEKYGDFEGACGIDSKKKVPTGEPGL